MDARIESHDADKRWTLAFALLCALLSAVPFLFGVLTAPAGHAFLGYPYATDDHMVYAAWMKQAQEGRFLFDNRFTFDAQPGLTVHLFFLALGWISKVMGIAWATTLVKSVLSAVLVLQLGGLVRRLTADRLAYRLAMVLAVFGGGLGFAVWQRWGEAMVRPSLLSRAMDGRLPIDVWQPEAFAASSMLTNALFVAALCLMVVVLRALLEARESWRPVFTGALAMLVLMNIHSYDVLLLILVAVGFVAALAASRQLNGAWLVRGVCIFLGALPSAAWFAFVLSKDAVFQQRAATPTFSPAFQQVVWGLLPLIALGLHALAIHPGDTAAPRRRWGAGALVLLLVVLGAASFNFPGNAYFVLMPAFILVLAVSVASIAIMARDPAFSLVTAWAGVGIVAPLFPALFQRKLAMGMAVPWGILAGLGLALLLSRTTPSSRRALSGLAALVGCFSMALWWIRDIQFITDNVSRTTVHELHLSADVRSILESLDSMPDSPRVVAPPGIPASQTDAEGRPLPDAFVTPILPDLNPILSGLAGVYTYAGHWSETPYYSIADPALGMSRRDASMRLFFRGAGPEGAAWLRSIGATHLVAPNRDAFPRLAEAGLQDMTSYGEVVYRGERWLLIRL